MCNKIFTFISVKVKDSIIKNSHNKMLLGVIIDAKLNFNCHIKNILKKLVKMGIPKRKLLISSFFISEFIYCQLTWMCPSRTINNYMKGASALYTVTRHNILKHYQKKVNLSPYILKIYILVKCLRFTRLCHQQ